ncbi:MAG: 23S rRNA (uracil(1939)-C(5))-methyltransferase RlmD, partial [bacterium]
FRIEGLGVNGEGISHLDGKTVFIPFALTQERISAKIFQVRKSYIRAELNEIFQPSPSRVQPSCPNFMNCGGCQLMHLNYKEQLLFKQKKVSDAIDRIGHLKNISISDCIPSPKQLNYRNKIEIPYQVLNNKTDLGFYSPKSNVIVPMTNCPVFSDYGNQVFTKVNALLAEYLLPSHCKTEKIHGISHIIIRTSHTEKKALVIIVTSIGEMKTLKKMAEQVFNCDPGILGVIQSINPGSNTGNQSMTIKLLYGVDYIIDKVDDTVFRAGALSFLQVNSAQWSNLIREVVKACGEGIKERVADVFCGIGFFTMFVFKSAEKVTGIDVSNENIKAAKFNLKKAGAQNTEFFCGFAEKHFRNINNPDLAILNPPRAGCSKRFLEILADKRVKKVVYVSCDPATLARDLRILSDAGYRVEYIQPMDMFPQTAHVECVAVMTRD